MANTKPNYNVVIGIDPDSAKHGVAVYVDSKLVDLCALTLFECMQLMDKYPGSLWVVEEVTKNNFVYARNDQKNKALQAQVGRSIGKCQQSMVELVRMLEIKGIEIVLIPPTKNNWAKDKEKFERLTGWTKRSNVDTRSAAYFGFLRAQ